jgi:hypothetical protein
MTDTIQRIVLASRPVGEPTLDNFRSEKLPIRHLGSDEMLLRTLWLSLDPYIDLLQAGAIGQSMGLPAGTAYNDIALGKLRDIRVNHFTDRAALHRIADANRFGVGRRIAHSAPHRDDVKYVICSDEYGVIEDPKGVLKINEKLRLVPGHCDPTCNVHDWYVGIRKGKVETLWPVSARGKAY